MRALFLHGKPKLSPRKLRVYVGLGDALVVVLESVVLGGAVGG